MDFGFLTEKGNKYSEVEHGAEWLEEREKLDENRFFFGY